MDLGQAASRIDYGRAATAAQTAETCTSFSEHDWRLLKSVHRVALERCCTRVLEECASILREKDSAHERYLRLYQLMKARDDSIAEAFNDLRRSTAVQRLAAMIVLEAVTDEEFSEFSLSAREAAMGAAEIWRANEERRGTP